MSLRMALVAIIGVGGLGCPVAVSLADADVHLRLVDDDRVELSNLQRQVLFRTGDIGRDKVAVAAERLGERYPDLRVETRRARLTRDNAESLLAGADLVVDASDDPAARFIVNDWGLSHRVPVVIGGVHRFIGMVLAHAGHGPCLRCLFEEDGPALETCAQGGVIGAMAGLVGHLQAERALQLLAGRTLAATGYVTTLDGLASRIRHVPLPDGCERCRDPSSPREEPGRAQAPRSSQMMPTG